MPQKRYILGAYFHAVQFEEVLQAISEAADKKNRLLIAYLNLHGIFLHNKNDDMKEIIDRANIVYPDGIPLILWRKMLWGDVSLSNRFTLSQELPALLRYMEKKAYKFFYLGSRENVLVEGLKNIRHIVPGLEISGRSGFFNKRQGAAENEQVFSQINSFIPVFGKFDSRGDS